MNSKKTARNREIFNLVFCALIIALIAVLSMPPYIGFVFALPFAGIQITILHIPVIFGGVLLGRKYSWILGLFFGLGSLWAAFNTGTFIFQNPLISVLPRLIFGFAIFEIFNLLSRIIKNQSLNFVITAVLSTIFHTLIVTLTILVFGADFYANTEEFIQNFIIPVISINAVVEIVLAAIIGLPIYKALAYYMNNKSTIKE